MRRPTILLLIASSLVWSTWAAPASAQAAAIEPVVGFVRDSISRRPVVNAEVRVVGTEIGVLTDGNGRFTIVPPAAEFVLEIGAFGYEGTRVTGSRSSAAGSGPLTISLVPTAIPLAEVVVSPGHFGVAQEVAVPQSVTRQEIETRPQLGEDIYRTVTRLPGVISDDFSARFNVRGGSNDQLLTTLDGVELYEPFHLKDLDASLSIIDVEAIGGVDLVTGGFPADRGDRLTGTFDLHTRSQPLERAQTAIGISLSNVRFLSRGGFAGGDGRWLVSARRGYLDILLKMIPDAEVGIEPRYYDFLAKVEWQANPRHLLSAHVLYSQDVGHFVPEGVDDPALESRYRSAYAWLGWDGRFGDRVTGNAIATLGGLGWVRDGSRLGFEDRVQDMGVSDVRDFTVGGIRQDWTLATSDRTLTRFGAEVKRVGSSFEYLRWERKFVRQGSTFVPRFDSTSAALTPSGHEVSFYLAERVRPVPSLTFELGGRFDRQSHTGDATWSPRLNFSYQPGLGFAVRGAWGRYYQSQEIFDLAVADGDTRFYPAELAEHRVLGVERTLENGASVRVELFDRELSHLRPRFRNLENQIELFPEMIFDRVRVEPEEGEARGVELFLKGAPGRRWGWSAGYALSRARERIGGEWVAYPMDQRHAFYLDAAFIPNARWRFAAAWQLHSGWPYTSESAVVTPVGNGKFEVARGFGPLYAERLPAYHRLDLRVTRDFTVGRGRLSVFADIFNVLDHSNVRGYEYSLDILDQTGRSELRPETIDLLPRLPSIGASYEF